MNFVIIQCTLLLLLFVFTRGNKNEGSKTFDKMDFLKRKHTIHKFEQQLISMLSVPPAHPLDESAQHKWMNMPDIVRKRLMASNDIEEEMEIKARDIFAPVQKVTNCISTNLTRTELCVKFKLGQSSLHSVSTVSTTFLYLDLRKSPNKSSSFFVKRVLTNSSLKFTRKDGNLLQVNINEFVPQNSNQTSLDTPEFRIICTGECESDTFEDAQLYLEINLRSKTPKRNKRSVDDSLRLCSDEELMCCKRSFTFRPADIGWNWIVAPEEITLNYCLGECNDQTSNYSYSKLFSILKRSKNSNLTPQQLESMRFCCAPKKYSSIEVIYLSNTNNSFQKVQLSNMIVDSCACI